MMSSTCVSKTLTKNFIQYYDELYEKYEVKSPSEIRDDLNICDTTLKRLLYLYCPTEGERVTSLGLKILLCTKFGPASPYKEVQKQYLPIIKKRLLRKQVQENIRRINKSR